MMQYEGEDRLRPWSPAIYRIEVEGELPDRYLDRFEGMEITTRVRPDQSVVTSLTGSVSDQTALTGMLDGLAELHLPILVVQQIHKDGNPIHEDPGQKNGKRDE